MYLHCECELFSKNLRDSVGVAYESYLVLKQRGYKIQHSTWPPRDHIESHDVVVGVGNNGLWGASELPLGVR